MFTDDAGAVWLTRSEVVELAERHGRYMLPSTFSGLVTRKYAPRPGRDVSRTPLWDRTAILEWLSDQPGTYTDPAHGITYVLDADRHATMTCRSCGARFIGSPADTESAAAPYDHSGDPCCAVCIGATNEGTSP